nr:MAG TPA: hypothetical protein [Bacteriophage sp.]
MVHQFHMNLLDLIKLLYQLGQFEARNHIMKILLWILAAYIQY